MFVIITHDIGEMYLRNGPLNDYFSVVMKWDCIERIFCRIDCKPCVVRAEEYYREVVILRIGGSMQNQEILWSKTLMQ